MVLWVNSLGGSVLVFEVIGREVKFISEEKFLIVFMGNIVVFGGYWIFMNVDWIFV